MNIQSTGTTKPEGEKEVGKTTTTRTTSNALPDRSTMLSIQ